MEGRGGEGEGAMPVARREDDIILLLLLPEEREQCHLLLLIEPTIEMFQQPHRCIVTGWIEASRRIITHQLTTTDVGPTCSAVAVSCSTSTINSSCNYRYS